MKTIFYNSATQFNLTDEEFDSFIKNPGKKVFIPRLNVFLSDMFIWAGEKPEVTNRRQNRDGQWCIDTFNNNDWRLENNRDVKIDLTYYPELKNLEPKPEYEKLTSIFGKELANKL